MKSEILLFAFVSFIIFHSCGVKKEKVEGLGIAMAPTQYVTDLEKVEQEFNLFFRVGRRLYGSSIYTNKNSRINYANIEIDDYTRIYSKKNRIIADVPLIAEVSYVEWQMAYGKKNSRDTILKDVEITLKLETELNINKEEELDAQTNIRVQLKNQAEFLKHLRGIKLFEKEGKFASTFQNTILRNSEVEK